jgi:hypothetical protein
LIVGELIVDSGGGALGCVQDGLAEAAEHAALFFGGGVEGAEIRLGQEALAAADE